MGAAGTAAAWPQAILPLIAEMQQALALPRFADLPRLDEALMPSPAAAAEMMLLVQQYLAAAMPAWVKASEAFQAEIAARIAACECGPAVAEPLSPLAIAALSGKPIA